MYTRKYVFLLITILLVSIFNLKFIAITKSQIEDNVKINVQVLQTMPNATYKEYPAFMAEVMLVYELNPEVTYNGTTDENGFISFTINVTGTYVLYISYPDAIFKPKEIYIRADTFNYFYEKVYRLAKFFGGDQETLARVIELNPKCSLVLKFPRAVNVNGTVKSYAGLTAKTYQSDTIFTVEFLDVCTPILNPQTGLYEMTNYTVTIDIQQTLEPGFVTLTLVSNGSIITDFAKLYYLPQGVSANFKFVVHVTPLKYVKELEQMQRKLDYIIDLLLKLIDMVNSTVIPKLDNLDSKMINSTLVLVDKIQKSTGSIISHIESKVTNMSLINVIYEKVKDIDLRTRAISNTLNIFVNDFPYQVKNIFSQSSKTIGNDTLISIVLFVALGLIVYVRTRTKPEEKGKLVITR